MKRRNFIQAVSLSAAVPALGLNEACGQTTEQKSVNEMPNTSPIAISTWEHGLAANQRAMELMMKGKSALDAVEAGVMVTELDPKITSVGYGGFPDRDGNVTLDACIMDHESNCGAVAFLQGIKTPIAVARKVMETTKHVLLVGEGAQKFAVESGFKIENLLTKTSERRWKEWKAEGKYDELKIDNANHDTIGLLAQDGKGNLSGACTTSGLAWKISGRVGDSPIIGAGLYVDNSHGAACATGRGEAVIKMAGSFLVVEFMRQGNSPEDACRMACERIKEQQKDYRDFQVGFIALNKAGVSGGYALHKNFDYALAQDGGNKLVDTQFID